jgi:hypothetical protein
MVPSVVVRSGSWELRALSLAVFSPQSRGLATYGWPLVSGLQRTCCPLWSAWISLGLLSGSLRALRVCTYTHTPSFQCNNVFCSMSILISILHHLFPSNICQKVWEGLICFLPLGSCVVGADADYPFPYFFPSMMVLDVGMFSPPLSTSSSNLRFLKIGYVRVGWVHSSVPSGFLSILVSKYSVNSLWSSILNVLYTG